MSTASGIVRFSFQSGEGTGSVLRGFTIRNGIAPDGGAIYCSGASPTITGNIFRDNIASDVWATGSGGAIYCSDGSPVISGNVFIDNRAGWLVNDFSGGSGGAVCLVDSPALIENNLFANNAAAGFSSGDGGGISLIGHGGGATVIRGCTFSGNWAFGTHYVGEGGGLYVSSATVTVESSIFWHDEAISAGQEISVRFGSVLTVNWSDVEGGEGAVFQDLSSVLWGPGMIDADPLFVAGPLGEFYLGQVAAGQPLTSPCVDAADPAAAMVTGTTRTDAMQDSGLLDMGYHYPLAGGDQSPPETTILSGPSGLEDSPVITFTFTGIDYPDPPEDLLYSWRFDDGNWSSYGSETWATFDDLTEGDHVFLVRARDTDGNIDPTPAEQTFEWEPWDETTSSIRLVIGPGPGPYNPPLVRTPQGEWLAYGAGGYGVNVACGDINGDGFDDVITGPGPSPAYGPQVRGWYLVGVPMPDVNFFAYGTLRYGVNVAAADLDGDGRDEIITGAGPGAVFGPHVRGWSYDGSSCEPFPGVSYFAYGTPKWGVNVAGGEVDGVLGDEIITGAGPGAVYGAHVRGWSYEAGTMVPANGLSFFAYGTPKWGVNVACGDIDGDGRDEIITGPGPGASFSQHIRAFNYNGLEVSPVPGVNFIAGTGHYGAVVTAADISDNGIDDIVVINGAGPDEPAVVTAYSLASGEVSVVSGSYDLVFGEWMSHGGKIAGVRNEGPRGKAAGQQLSAR